MSLAIAASLITACSNEEELAYTAAKGMLSATVEGSHSSTRAGFAENGSFYWSQNDQLGVTTTQSSGSFSGLNLASGKGTANGVFNGEISGTIGEYAVYPHNDSHSLSGTSLTYKFPTSYTYTKVDADYFTETQGEGNSFNPAMWGKIENGSVTMKHLGGVFCIKIPQMPVTAGTLSLIANRNITGEFTVALNDNTPVAKTGETETDNENTVKITFSNVAQGQPGVFYVPVPTGTYDVRIKITEATTSDQNTTTPKINVAAGTYTIARCDLKKIELTNGGVDATVPTESNSLSDAQSNFESNDAIRVTQQVSGTNNTISIPAVTNSSDNTTAKSLSLEKIDSGASLTVSDANTSSSGNDNTSVANFTLSIPNNETDNFTPLNVTITMPQTTVTLTGNAGAAKYGEVTAETADNTLIIDNNVEVKKVTVKKGNIRVNKGAKITEIAKDNDNQSTSIIIYKEEGAEIPSSLGEGFEVVNIDNVIADIKEAFGDGAECTVEKGTVTFKLTKDIVLASQVITKGNIVLDLNSHTISNTSDIWGGSSWSLISVQGGTLTIKDTENGSGKLAAKENDCYAIDMRNENAILNIEGGEFVGNIHAVYVYEGVANIKGGTYSILQQSDIANKAYEFVLNCYDANYQADPKKANIIVTGGTFHKFNPASNGAEGALNSTNFCAEGYTANKSDDNSDIYVVAKQNSNGDESDS